MQRDEKRQLLAAILGGETKKLFDYRISQQKRHSVFRRIIDTRPTGGRITGQDKQGNNVIMTSDQLEVERPFVQVWLITDHTGARHVPEPDEDYD